jgi:transposase-like protein
VFKKMKCPKCTKLAFVRPRGRFTRKIDGRMVRRFHCLACKLGYSSQTSALDYRHKKPWINQRTFNLLCKGTSQRATAQILGVRPAAIARRVVRFGQVAKANLATYRATRPRVTKVVFDEMESFEHTKCKPLTIPLAVEDKTRRILAVKVGSIAAKGPLAAISLKKYGPRRCDRRKLLRQLFSDLKVCCIPGVEFSSDESRHYPVTLRKIFPQSTHTRFKGRRGCIVGQGELKSVKFDPLFSLNHTCAMIRDNIKRMTRRTWCTTKRPDRLEYLLNLYAYFHNMILDGIKQPKLTTGLYLVPTKTSQREIISIGTKPE